MKWLQNMVESSDHLQPVLARVQVHFERLTSPDESVAVVQAEACSHGMVKVLPDTSGGDASQRLPTLLGRLVNIEGRRRNSAAAGGRSDSARFGIVEVWRILSALAS